MLREDVKEGEENLKRVKMGGRGHRERYWGKDALRIGRKCPPRPDRGMRKIHLTLTIVI